MQSCEFTFQGPWTNETHCHFILSTLKTPLWDVNIPDSGYIKYIIIGPKPDCQLGNIYLLNFFFFCILLDSVLVHSRTIPVPILEWLYSAGINGTWNGNFGRALPKIIPLDFAGFHRNDQIPAGITGA